MSSCHKKGNQKRCERLFLLTILTFLASASTNVAIFGILTLERKLLAVEISC
jgi:hypothetical protein